MGKVLNTFIAVALVSLFPAISIYAGTQSLNYTESQAILIATQFLKGSLTYSFDGIDGTIELVEVDTIRMPYTWAITIKFQSRNAGYGDREGQMLAQIITEHTTVIVVSRGEVLSAVTDEVFDEKTGTMINMPPSPVLEAEKIATEWLRNAPTYSFDGIDGTMKIVESLVLESYPEQYIIAITFACSQPGYGDRTDEVLAMLITEHTAVVRVVNQQVQTAVIDSTWDELNQQDKESTGILLNEEAVYIVIGYLHEHYPKASTLVMTDEWTVADLTPEGLIGKSTIQYCGDGWTITVSYPVVWKPIYSFEFEHTSGFTWSGTVDQSGQVSEKH